MQFVAFTELGPNVADYPYGTIPHKVDPFFRAQLFQGRKQHWEGRRMSPEECAKKPRMDDMGPINADADTGHGGLTATMKLAKHVHRERRCRSPHRGPDAGHEGADTSAARSSCRLILLQADSSNTPLVIVGRRDMEVAKMTDPDINPIDHPHIKGSPNPQVEAIKKGNDEDW